MERSRGLFFAGIKDIAAEVKAEPKQSLRTIRRSATAGLGGGVLVGLATAGLSNAGMSNPSIIRAAIAGGLGFVLGTSIGVAEGIGEVRERGSQRRGNR